MDLGERLMSAFASPSGIPYSDVNLGTRVAHAPEWSHYSTTAEVTTVQLEFRQLSRASNNPSYEVSQRPSLVQALNLAFLFLLRLVLALASILQPWELLIFCIIK